ncbi:MAG TPA: multiheme c-type cytochrome [Labilithrix sp.]|nr:multiheme c-type cytochrome [Labilithrix sp.]
MTHATVALVTAGVALFAGCGTDKADEAAPKLTREALQDPQSCAGCHPDHLREWSGSMHAYAGVDPVFLALNKRMQRETNGALGTFCVQCHAPVAVRMGATKDGLNLAQLDPKLLGVTCYFCHNAEFNGGDLHNNPLALTDDGVMRGGFANPVANTAHEARYASSMNHTDDSSSIFCGSCHDIVNPQSAHIERTFKEWTKSHFAVEDRTNCGACHMPERTGLAAQAPGVLVRKVHDHSMPGVDVALTPFPERESQRTGIQKMLDDAISAKLCVTADAAAGVHVEVTLRSEKVGHSWPSGSAQDRRAWVEIEGTRGGAAAFASGRIPDDRSVAASADAQIFLLRDYDYDADGRETSLFWKTKTFKNVQLPVASSLRSPEADRSVLHAYTFPGAMPDKVTMRVKIRPLDFDLLTELVTSGDLDPGVAALVPTITLASTQLTWQPGGPCVATP